MRVFRGASLFGDSTEYHANSVQPATISQSTTTSSEWRYFLIRWHPVVKDMTVFLPDPTDSCAPS